MFVDRAINLDKIGNLSYIMCGSFISGAIFLLVILGYEKTFGVRKQANILNKKEESEESTVKNL